MELISTSENKPVDMTQLPSSQFSSYALHNLIHEHHNSNSPLMYKLHCLETTRHLFLTSTSIYPMLMKLHPFNNMFSYMWTFLSSDCSFPEALCGCFCITTFKVFLLFFSELTRPNILGISMFWFYTYIHFVIITTSIKDNFI